MAVSLQRLRAPSPSPLTISHNFLGQVPSIDGTVYTHLEIINMEEDSQQ